MVQIVRFPDKIGIDVIFSKSGIFNLTLAIPVATANLFCKVEPQDENQNFFEWRNKLGEV